MASQQLVAEFVNTVGNSEVWLAIALALLLGGAFLVFGVWVARTVGLLESGAPAGETLGVGLGSGLVVFVAWWAAIWSGGRSSFTPVAVGFAIAVALAILLRSRRPKGDESAVDPADGYADAAVSRSSRRRSLVAAGAGGAFVVAIALLYGSTLATSPRDGAQPVEFVDEAFYSVLGRDLATTGMETQLPPSGFSDVVGVPAQAWYHWAELWLASAVITVFGTAPVAARHLIVLPLVLLAAAALTGTLVRRMARTDSSSAYLFGVVACVFLAPMPFFPIPFFGASNVGLVFGLASYGLAAVAVLLALYSVSAVSERRATWALAFFVGSLGAFILPAHTALGLLAVGSVLTVWMVRVVRSILATRRPPDVAPVWRRSVVVAGVGLVATVVWSTVTGHGLGAGAVGIVSPFNETWRDTVLITVLGGGAFFAIAIEWFFARKEPGVLADVYLGTAAILVASALAWGARLGEFTMFHAFYGAIAVIATPVAVIAIRALWQRLRATNHRRLAAGLVILCAVQLEFGVVSSILRMQIFGPHDYVPTPISLLTAIRGLPADAKLAYACATFEEVSFVTPRLLSVDAHTGHRIVPMCYAAEYLSSIMGGELSVQIPNLYFQPAPQRLLYPDASAHPSSAAVAAFLKDHGIDYIYADKRHPNSLVTDAVPIATSGDFVLLRLP